MATNNNVYEDTANSAKEFVENEMSFFDTRLYRQLSLYNGEAAQSGEYIYPHMYYGSFVGDYYTTLGALKKKKEETKRDDEKKYIDDKIKFVKNFNEKNKNNYLAQRSFIHPYALVKLAGAYGKQDVIKNFLTFDQYNRRKFYEVDGEPVYSGNYSKTPTTTALIKWGNESDRGTTPYSFQDFIFCKWWNRIENNRLITLRRYATPVSDLIDFPDYNTSDAGANSNEEGVLEYTKETKDGPKSERIEGRVSTSPWAPIATAVTYFGDETGNKLSDILRFSANYRWKQLNNNEKDPINISSQQNDMGNGGGNLISPGLNTLSSGLGSVAKVFGFISDTQTGMGINLDSVKGSIPDPYNDGPYENRILGPINVITNTYRRERGLEFKQNGLKIKFEYVARPIAGINNKAVLLDLMSNILLLTYASGTWFGGMWKYSTSNPALYPWRYGDVMNELYKGNIWGEKGAPNRLIEGVFNDGRGSISTFLPDAAQSISKLFSGAVDSILGLFTGNQERKESGSKSLNEVLGGNISKSIQKIIASKAIKGSTIPYLQHQRALLTGEPVGDWHLTIGNPLNPIAMIGNLIVKNVTFDWSDELGPDDFPIGFTATIELDHGLGRDRDAIESMFNRGYGRIYTLPNDFRSSADGETKVDDYTGNVNTTEGRTVYDEIRNTYFGGGTRFIAKIEQSELKNKGAMYLGDTRNMESLKPTDTTRNHQQTSIYYINQWQMAHNL